MPVKKTLPSRSTLRKQIRWLCNILAKRTQTILDCPPNIEPKDDCLCGMSHCADCWRRACVKAVKEEPCQ